MSCALLGFVLDSRSMKMYGRIAASTSRYIANVDTRRVANPASTRREMKENIGGFTSLVGRDPGSGAGRFYAWVSRDREPRGTGRRGEGRRRSGAREDRGPRRTGRRDPRSLASGRVRRRPLGRRRAASGGVQDSQPSNVQFQNPWKIVGLIVIGSTPFRFSSQPWMAGNWKIVTPKPSAQRFFSTSSWSWNCSSGSVATWSSSSAASTAGLLYWP